MYFLSISFVPNISNYLWEEKNKQVKTSPPQLSFFRTPNMQNREIYKSYKDKHDISLIYGIFKKKKRVQMNLTTKEKWNHRCRKQAYGDRGGKEKGLGLTYTDDYV